LEKLARAPVEVMAPTAITFAQLAGDEVDTFEFSLPGRHDDGGAAVDRALIAPAWSSRRRRNRPG
jgi:hypothetical protein